MAQKKVSKDPFSEFLSVFEKQRKEMEKLAKPFLEYPKRMEKVVKPFLDYQQRTEKMAKPILEYQRKLFEESKRFHEALTQNVVETIGEVINQMIEEHSFAAETIFMALVIFCVLLTEMIRLRMLHKIQER